ncbi:type VI secretion system contractile sheath small subunit [Corallococcus sp. AB004]|uniref:type VI secretion system contractile sheath small subunit n=1 Tax=Corallococcus TaxID=83461 RepID=UPI000EA1B53D|nr:type VI secretion system contractile sheath small subunit [Corallococcus sp. AB038B]NPC71202.1 type VI secretion system contractile sheath small subunit [Corallococcus exiguus]RKI43070.1 type VI secretion system contractile sheath small subunit [Corallococcus sp. AB004]NPD25564.1 type VI secretion system contractile sheath small subunit [Corallococcus exiguus]NRD46177.1 type VI secretion system contractile sheath small subunit [Corallococcus exiguus]NRD51784.1 type VI secretion system contr
MSKEGSVAPKERVNIVYKSETGNAQSEVELPLKILMVGDYTGRQDERPVEERAPINIDKGNFNEVMAKQGLSLDASVPDRLSNEADASMSVSLKFQTLADFTPEGIVNQVPELKQLLELRAALNALKGPLGNVPAFRKKIQTLLGDSEGRQRLMAELGLGTKSE